MIKDYLMRIEEISGMPTNPRGATVRAFKLDEVKNGPNASGYGQYLPAQLFSATKVMIIENHGDRYVWKAICLPSDTRNVVKDRIERIVPTSKELIKALIEYHNSVCEQIGAEPVSVEELVEAYKKKPDYTV